MMSVLRSFQSPSLSISLWQFGSTFSAFAVLNLAMYWLVQFSVWLSLALAVPAAGLMVRLFIIQHDCGHGSFFRSRRLNDMLGRFCSLLTLTPYAFWRRQHANHHASFNNLDRREPGIDLYSGCATLREYEAFPPLRRLIYRVLRHPTVSQLLLPPLVFLLAYRLPFDAPASWAKERASVYLTNLAIVSVIAGLVLLFGLRAVALVQLPIIAITSIVGVWLFTVQHRFEAAQWMQSDAWSPEKAALDGSSYLKLPRVLQWFTGNIGFHHVHHMAARIPNYRLQKCHESRHEMSAVCTLTLGDALRAPCFPLWDEVEERMVRFPQRRAERRAKASALDPVQAEPLKCASTKS